MQSTYSFDFPAALSGVHLCFPLTSDPDGQQLTQRVEVLD